jgi:hypothetical protein
MKEDYIDLIEHIRSLLHNPNARRHEISELEEILSELEQRDLFSTLNEESLRDKIKFFEYNVNKLERRIKSRISRSNYISSFPEENQKESLEEIRRYISTDPYRRRSIELKSEIDKVKKIQEDLLKLNTRAISSQLNKLSKVEKIDEIIEAVSDLEKKLDLEKKDRVINQLSNSYREARDSYGIQKKQKARKKSSNAFIRFVTRRKYGLKYILQPHYVLYMCFLGSLAGLSLVYLHTFSEYFDSLEDIGTKNNPFNYAPIICAMPLLWIAWFSQRKITLRNRLYEVYNHKYRFVETYLVMKKNVEDFEIQTKLEEQLLDCMEKDTSQYLEKNIATPLDTLASSISNMKLIEKK